MFFEQKLRRLKIVREYECLKTLLIQRVSIMINLTDHNDTR
jgi:hypothetical protein